MDIDIGQLVSDIKGAAKKILDKDLETFKGFEKRQLDAIALQSAMVSAEIVRGHITADTQEFFLGTIKTMTRTFVNTLVGLVAVTIEKLWNAIIGTIWKAITNAAGVTLPTP